MSRNGGEGLHIREMKPEDAEAVEQVEKACFSVPWSRESFWREAANENTCYLLAESSSGQVLGYAGCWVSFGEGQITNVAVAPEARRKQVGTALLTALIEAVKSRGVTALTLEVRPSNGAALALYGKFGFQPAGRRPRYYTDNGEDAIIMWNTKI